MLAMLLCVGLAADGDPAALQAKTVELVKKLGAGTDADKDKAADELVKLGPAALPHLPPGDDKSLTADQKSRLGKVLPKLWQARVERDTQGSWVEIPAGSMPLADLLQTVEKQTGNPIRDQREEFNEEATNPTVKWDGKKRRFWEAMDLICTSAGVGMEHFAGDNTIGIRAGAAGRTGAGSSIAGALRFNPQTITLTRQIGEPAGKMAVNIQAIFEPKLRPVLVEVNLDDFKILDDKNREIAFGAELQQKAFSFSVSEGAHDFEIALDLTSPPRDANAIKSIEGTATLLLPAVTESFEFDKWTEKEMQQKTATSMRVKCGNAKDEGDGLWSFELRIGMLGERPEGESFAAANLEPDVLLVHSDGTKLAPNAGKSIKEEEGEIVVEFLTSGVPGKMSDYKIVAKLPSGISKVPVKFAIKDLPLP